MKKMFTILVTLSFIVGSCGSQKTLKNKGEAYKIINKISNNPFILVEDSYFKNKYRKDLPEYLNKSYFSMLQSLKLEVPPDSIKALFSDIDFEFMRKQAKENGSIKWKEEYLEKDIKVQEKPIIEPKMDVLNLSYPVFSRNFKYAVVRVEGNSGNLTIFKKENGEWKKIAIILIWIS